MDIDSLKKIDITLISVCLLLCFIGSLNIFSTTYFPEKEASGLFYNQLIYYFVGLFGLVFLTVFDYRKLNKLFVQIIIFFCTIGLLVSVLFLGEYILGARRWISIGGFTIQPSEFAKIGLILLNAFILSIEKPILDKRKKISKVYKFILNNFLLSKILLSFFVLITFIALIIAQNSLGNSILLFGIFLVIFTSYFPVNGKYLSAFASVLLGSNISFNVISFGPLLFSDSLKIPVVVFLLSILIIYALTKIAGIKIWILLLIFFLVLPLRFSVEYSYNNILKDYQRTRIEAFINPDSDTASRWNKDQARIALGSGKIFGKGFLKGTHSNYKFLPFSYNDFAFASLGEQFGFIGLFVVGFLFSILLNRIVKIAKETKDSFGRILVFGVSGMIFLNMFQHMGMNVGILPITGVPLPFVSYGGSSTLVMMAGIGLVLSVSIHGEKFSNVKRHHAKPKFRIHN